MEILYFCEQECRHTPYQVGLFSTPTNQGRVRMYDGLVFNKTPKTRGGHDGQGCGSTNNITGAVTCDLLYVEWPSAPGSAVPPSPVVLRLLCPGPDNG